MLIRVGETVIDVNGQEVPHKVIQALDPDTEFPVAQIAIPIGEQSELIGKIIAGETPEQATGLIIPDAPPLPDDLRDV